jgi:hypothetical protein
MTGEKWAWVIGLGLVAAYSIFVMIGFIIEQVVKENGPITSRDCWNGFCRVACLLGPGIMFWVWAPPHTAMSEPQALVWLAWPILAYTYGRNDGKSEK